MRSDYDSGSQLDFENDQIDLYRVSDKGSIDIFKLNFRIALSTFLNNILLLDIENKQNAQVSPLITHGTPYPDSLLLQTLRSTNLTLS